MKKLLIISSLVNDIFICNIAKWLKSQTDIQIDIFHYFDSDEQKCDLSVFDSITRIDNKGSYFRGSAFKLRHQARKVSKMLEGRHYDIIQCHGALSITVQIPHLEKYCDKLCLTFWGGEMDTMKVWWSNRIYRMKLRSFLKSVTHVINSPIYNRFLTGKYPFLEGKVRNARFGSAPLENLSELMEKETKDSSKQNLDIDPTKLTVLIGYSGKEVHRHLAVINEFTGNERLKEKLHLLAPMTRGAHKAYTQNVENALKSSGYSYTLLKDRFLTDEDIARLRNATDITLQMSEYDGFSRSIVECLCAKSILIFGDWLDYDIRLSEEGFKGIKVESIKECIEKISQISDNREEYSKDCEMNHTNGFRNNLWNNCIADWIRIYSE